MNRTIRRMTVILGLLMSVTILTGCFKTGPDPIEFNNKLVRLQMDIAEKMKALGEKLGGSEKVVEADALKDLDDINTLIDTNTKELDTLETPEGGVALKTAIKDIFNFYKQAVANEFKQMVQILAKETNDEADVTKIQELQNSINEKETVLDQKVQDAQTAFAKKYGFSVE